MRCIVVKGPGVNGSVRSRLDLSDLLSSHTMGTR